MTEIDQFETAADSITDAIDALDDADSSPLIRILAGVLLVFAKVLVRLAVDARDESA
jgi:hypothetical protein